MATRMQQRRGTAAQWISTNSGNGPILNAGEIGYETDTNKFKIGDGTNHWINLDYFVDANSTVNPAFGTSIVFEGATADSYETTLQVTDPTTDRTITLPDATGTIVLADGSGNVTVSGNLTVSGTTTTINSTTINATTGIVFEGATVDAFETTLTVTDPTADRTLTLPNSTGTIATEEYVDSAVSGAEVDQSTLAGTGISWNAGTSKFDVDTLTIQARVADVSDTEIGYLNGVTSAIQTQLDNKSTESKTETLTNKTINANANTITVTSANVSDFNEAAQDAVGNAVTNGITYTDSTGALGLNYVTVGNTLLDGVSGSSYGLIGTSTYLDIKDTNGYNKEIELDIAAVESKLVTDGFAKLASPTFTGTVTVPTPVNSTDATTKAYVDAVTEGLHIHESVIAATTTNVALSSALENGDTLDGITLATGNRILVKNQTTQSENGIYVVQASGQPVRATDFDTAAEVDSGDFVFVYSGTVNGGTGWVQTNKPATIGTNAIAFTQFSGAGTYTAGNGLTLTGTTFTIDTSITQARVADVSDTEIGYLNGVTSAIQTQLDAKIAKADITAKGAILVGTGAGTYAAQSVGTNGQVLTANSAQADGVEWTTISGYSAPTLGSTSIASGATVTTIAGLTLSSPTITGSLTAGGGTGTSGQVLSSTGSGVQWSTPAAGAAFSELMLIGA